MEKNLILAIVLSVVVLVVYNIFFMPKPPLEESTSTSQVPSQEEKIEEKVEGEPFVARGESITLENANITLQVNTEGGVIDSWYIKNKKKDLLKKEKPIRFYLKSEDGEVFNFSGTRFEVKEKKEREIVLFWEDEKENIKIKEVLRLPEQGYHVFYELSAESPGRTKYEILHPVKIGEKLDGEERLAFWGSYLYKEKKEGVRAEYDGKIRWMGVRKKKDFIAIMIPLTSIERGFFKKEDFGFSTSSDKASFIIYSGPQSYPYVRLVNNIVKERLGEDYHLTDALEIGAWGYLSVGLSKILIFFYSFTKNYGLAIILLTLLIYGALSPLSIKQFESMQKMQLIQPELKKIQQKYKNDPRKMQAEMMKIYGKYKINPMAGCLPMFIQLPIIFVLYRALLDFPFAENPSFLWIKNLGKPDIPLLLALAGCMFLQQRVSQRAQRGKDQEGITKIMQFFPLFLIVILWSLPSGVMLYWFTSTLISIVQQLIITRKTVTI
ncbi:MAG TPA: membrane protein insertase YidC [Candidatus Aerophobetes bacterium]|uniref:Membrane protein insertase YidC n=1 Tax=Aerophobetes bacterium TaxID=2030807 RepID=A0A7V5HZP2_UNCAE|nr:membrane protein insertase YidC [Candidatus Aerophobetes bacterium]